MFNHSCCHNCVVTYEEANSKSGSGGTTSGSSEGQHMQVIRAIVPVKKGEELTHP